MKNIDFGMPTLIETTSLENCAKLCKELGLKFIELNMNMPQYQEENMDIKKLRKICENEDIYFTIHLDENLNVCDFNKRVAEAYVITVMDTIRIAKKLNSPVINMHMASGVYFTMPDEKVFLFDKYKEIYLGKLKAFRDLCSETIAESNIKICIENCAGYEKFAEEGIGLLLESSIFQLTLDIGHNHSAGGVDESFINKHIDRLYHMHVHDAKGRKNHLPLGVGEIDIREKLMLAETHKCRAVLETKTIEGLRQSVRNLANYI
ncbi:sugar phosphate isomerase/epimerase [Clostridium sp. 19966]|uniref:sugar phosphate isomerase/epimerase family protein n=1 Tax=Clostridium sp. 19966 TaxID=2768166 RepID=UPI0028DE1CDE|nr:sugar phosphate isomerase/epimerase family protein [Clostridium sp. 19966]MDT8717688.1 sugar phosphate isomerase/epimerase [Clostridium sp. 19966]